MLQRAENLLGAGSLSWVWVTTLHRQLVQPIRAARWEREWCPLSDVVDHLHRQNKGTWIHEAGPDDSVFVSIADRHKYEDSS